MKRWPSRIDRTPVAASGRLLRIHTRAAMKGTMTMAIVWNTAECVMPMPRSDGEAAGRDALIHLGSVIDAGNLTDETICEWFIRIRLWERRSGVKRDQFFNDTPLADVLRRWVGLTLNVPYSSRAEWYSKAMESDAEQAANEFEIECAVA